MIPSLRDRMQEVNDELGRIVAAIDAEYLLEVLAQSGGDHMIEAAAGAAAWAKIEGGKSPAAILEDAKARFAKCAEHAANIPWLPPTRAAADVERLLELTVRCGLLENEVLRLGMALVEVERDNAVLRKMVALHAGPGANSEPALGNDTSWAGSRDAQSRTGSVTSTDVSCKGNERRFPTLAQMAGDGVPR